MRGNEKGRTSESSIETLIRLSYGLNLSCEEATVLFSFYGKSVFVIENSSLDKLLLELDSVKENKVPDRIEGLYKKAKLFSFDLKGM